MAREKKSVHKVQMTDGKRNIIRQLLEEYEIESAQAIQDALKDRLGGTIKEMMESEMDERLGYRKSERSGCDDYRNGYKTKQVNSSYGSMKVEVPQDRNSTFEPQVVKKRQKDEENSISMCLLYWVQNIIHILLKMAFYYVTKQAKFHYFKYNYNLPYRPRHIRNSTKQYLPHGLYDVLLQFQQFAP